MRRLRLTPCCHLAWVSEDVTRLRLAVYILHEPLEHSAHIDPFWCHKTGPHNRVRARTPRYLFRGVSEYFWLIKSNATKIKRKTALTPNGTTAAVIGGGEKCQKDLLLSQLSTMRQPQEQWPWNILHNPRALLRLEENRWIFNCINIPQPSILEHLWPSRWAPLYAALKCVPRLPNIWFGSQLECGF